MSELAKRLRDTENRLTASDISEMRNEIADALDAAEAALGGIDTFAWSAMSADCTESRAECQSRIDAARAALAKIRGK